MRGPEDISTERTGQWVLYLNSLNQIRGCDIRNGQLVASLNSPLTCKGICFNREADKFIVGQLSAGSWFASEYNYPEMTLIRQWNLTTLAGVTSLNSLRYTANNRYILVGHSTGSYVLNTFTGAEQEIDEPLVGDVKQFECLSTMYAMFMRSSTNLNITQINTGRDMLYIGELTWDELSTGTWNWEVDEVTPYPHLILGNRRGSQWYVSPFKLLTWEWYDSDQWDIALPSKPLSIAFSEVDNSLGVPKESTFGRAFVVFMANGYNIYNLLTGELIAEYTSTPHSSLTCGHWKEAQGLYL